MSGPHLTVQDALDRLLFGVEYNSFSGEPQTFLTRYLGYRSFSGEVSIEDAQVAVRFDRIIKGTNQVLPLGVGGVRFGIGNIFS